ncbi:MAG: hypothetical protein ACRDT4_20300 [Micromonosporaceae bacterium]
MTGRTVHRLDAAGTVRDWLVSPAWSAPCDDLDQLLDATGSPWGAPGQRNGRWVLTNGPDVAPLKQRLYERRPLVVDQPLPEVVEDCELRWRAPGGGTERGVWRRAYTGADGLVDWSAFCHTPTYRHALAATVLEVDQAEWRTVRLASTGPAAIWVGGELVGVSTDVGYMEPVERSWRVRLSSGLTPVHVATWQVALRECRQVVRLRIAGLPVRVVIPSPGADEYASTVSEQLLDTVGVRAWAVDRRDGEAELTGPTGAALRIAVDDVAPQRVLLADGTARVPLARPSGTTAEPASMLASAERRLRVRVDDDRCPVFRDLHVAPLPPHRRDHPVGTPADWRRELLAHVAGTAPSAGRALARWASHGGSEPYRVEPAELATALRMIRERADCADFEAHGLLHLWHRVPAGGWPDGLRDQVRDALLGFKYWIDQPGLDAMCYFTENHQLVWHTAELLAGEAWPDQVFGNTGWTGRQHAAHGAELAREWLRRKLAGGFSEYDSNAYLAIDTLALVSVVEYAADPALRALAEALLDKLLFSLAANSWRGVHGAAHGRSYVSALRSSRFEETAPIMWLAWGTGALNDAVLPATVLATATRYRLPGLVRAIGQATDDEWYGRQVYRGEYRLRHDLLDRSYGSDLRIYRTPDAMLASVQDYRYGLPGLQEHIWGATLGAEVQVFATHPANTDRGASARPNAWAGHRVLPRARQHRDTVLALHRFPTDDPSGRTHLWLPTAYADQWRTAGPWVAARVGDGYVAVATDCGVRLETAGNDAYQVFHPRGSGGGWVCVIGRAATDGDFDQFLDALGAPEFGADAVAYRTRHGERLALSWEGPFTVDGRAVDLGGDGRPESPPHLENPACRVEFGAATLEAAYAGERLVLDLAHGRRLAGTGLVALGGHERRSEPDEVVSGVG